MAAHIFVRTAHCENFEDSSRQLLLTLGITTAQVRESSSYVCGSYLQGEAIGIEVRVARADEQELSVDYLWLALESVFQSDEPSFCDQLADSLARFLAGKGYQVVRPECYGVAGGRWIAYKLCVPNESISNGAVVAEYL